MRCLLVQTVYSLKFKVLTIYGVIFFNYMMFVNIL